MIQTIYIEEEVLNYPKTLSILNRFPNAHRVTCNRYSEIFNLKSQQFRTQKKKPSLILAKKYGEKILKVPDGYHLGKPHNYYFSHMLNCLFDCRYCFLQGMYRSAHYVVFVNFSDFQSNIEELSKKLTEEATFYSGYDGDSLAFEHVTEFISDFIPFFKRLPQHELEIRTKSASIRPFLKHAPMKNIIIAYSLNPKWVVERFENKTARLHQRLKAIQSLQKAGWPIGLRFDPIIYHPNWKQNYADFFEQVFESLDLDKIHSVTLGPFRLPQTIYKSIQSQFPDEALFFHEIDSQLNTVTYRKELEHEMHHFCASKILEKLPESLFYPSLSSAL
ncbi:MAG: Spore photoproduct lyase [Chlamydiae bacterium]|nr:Spore photoproduct lyase [Chlamydiota bacterium]